MGSDGAKGLRAAEGALTRRLALGLVMLSVAWAPATAQEPGAAGPPGPRWTAAATYTFDEADSDLPHWERWHQASVSLGRRFEGGALVGEVYGASRLSGEWERGAAVDAYADLWSRAYANARVRHTEDAVFLPGDDLHLELFQGFGDAWEGSGGLRSMRFEDDHVEIASLSLSRYQGLWYLSARASRAFHSRGGAGNALRLAARRYLGDDPEDWVELNGSVGSEVVHPQAGVSPELRSTRAAGARWQGFPAGALGFSAGVGALAYEGLPARLALTLGTMVRW